LQILLISSLGIVPKITEDYVCSIINTEEKEKLRYGRIWLKRMIKHAIRRSFEFYIKAGNKISNLDQVATVNEDIVKLDSSINMNHWALNEKRGYDAKIKEKIDAEKARIVEK
jgi:hypothetical protein